MLDYLGFPDTQEDVDKLMNIVDSAALQFMWLLPPDVRDLSCDNMKRKSMD